MNIVILTPIPVEHRAILARLTNVSEKILGEHHYSSGKFEGQNHTFNILTVQTGAGNETVALAAERAVRFFQPLMVVLAGVAGGVKDVNIGDVVVGTKYYGYESGKVMPAVFATRPQAGYYSKEPLAAAKSVVGKNSWHHRIKNTSAPKVVFGAIAGGNKVVTATDSDIYRLLKQNYNDTIALEMEAAGFGQVMQSYPTIRFLNIRGISDLLDNKSKSDGEGSQQTAAENMSAFLFELLYQLDMSGFKVFGSMNIKELSKEIIKLVLPAIKSKSLHDTNFAVRDVSDPVQELLREVEPLLADEYGELLKNPDDAEALADVRNELRFALKGEDKLRLELEKLVKKAQKERVDTGTTMGKSKNVIQGSSISVGGDFHLGDKM